MSFEVPPPDPTNPDLLIGVFEYLKLHGVCRLPTDATTQSSLPPLWIEPRHGCPAPGQEEGLQSAEVAPNPPEGPGLVISIENVTGIPPLPYEGFLRTSHVQFVIRSYVAQAAFKLEQVLREKLNDKRNWTMYNVPVNESLLWRTLQPISRDNLAYTYSLEYQFQLWGPYTPV